LPPDLQEGIRRAVELTARNERLIVNVALNYGGRREIAHAVRRIVEDGLPPEQVTEELIASYLYTSHLPDPDLIVRTAGEMRLSNFLIWQAAYSEFYSTPVYWPDFGPDELRKALLAYSQRTRKYGALPDTDSPEHT
jgi:undecaprenyl diphosphate synthase